MKFEPHEYQRFIIDKIINTKKILVALDMGLGKTVSTLSALDYLIFDSLEVNKVLIIAPLRVASWTWEEEITKFDHLKYLEISKIIGSEDKRIKALNKESILYTINRENVVWLIEYYLKNKLTWPFDTIVIDESSSFKSHSSKRFKALKKVCQIANRVIELTGTPAPNSLMDLWSQVYLLDEGKRLGRTITLYRQMYFYPKIANGNIVYKYELKKGSEEIIFNKLSDIMVSLKAIDHLKLPDKVIKYIKLEMPEDVKKKYQELERNYILTIDKQNITALSAGVVTNKLLQMANGQVYDELKNVIKIHDLKIEALIDLIELNQGKPILVFYAFKHDLSHLLSKLDKYKPKQLLSDLDIKEWNLGHIRLMLCHPASMGHGINLQSGGNIIVWYGLTWSLELYQQANARLYRQGQNKPVFIYHLITKDTVDEDVIKRLESKEQGQDMLIEALKARINKVAKA